MTIQDLNTYIKDNCPNIVPEEIPITYFSGKSIAIDAHFIMYKFMAVSLSETLPLMNIPFEPIDETVLFKAFVVHLLDYLYRFMKLKINPIMVFDGDKNLDKKPVHEKRQQQKEKRKAEIDELTFYILEKTKDNILEQSNEIVSGKISQLKKLLSQHLNVSRQHVDDVIDILAAIGIEYYVAQGDGERLCSILAIEGTVAAVVSTDSDCFAHGCPLIISEITQEKMYDKNGELVQKIKIRRLFDILIALGINFQRFVQFCIMSGCDYNERCFRISDYKEKKEKEGEVKKEEKNVYIDPKTNEKKKKTSIGVGRAFEALKEFKTIENLPNDYIIENLNYKRCMELFEYVPSKQLIQNLSLFPKKELDEIEVSERNREIMKQYSLEYYVDSFLELKKL